MRLDLEGYFVEGDACFGRGGHDSSVNCRSVLRREFWQLFGHDVVSCHAGLVAGIVSKCKRMGMSPEEAARRARASGVSDLDVTKDLKRHYGLSLADAERILVELAGQYPSVEAYDAAILPLFELAFRYPDADEQDFDRFEATTGIPIKTAALARQGRIEEALRWRERLGAKSPHLVPIELPDAQTLAAELLAEREVDVRILDDRTLEFHFGWVFFYQSAEFLETGAWTKALGGNAPIIVDRYTAVAHVTGTAEPIETYVNRYETTGDPHSETA